MNPDAVPELGFRVKLRTRLANCVKSAHPRQLAHKPIYTPEETLSNIGGDLNSLESMIVDSLPEFASSSG